MEMAKEGVQYSQHTGGVISDWFTFKSLSSQHWPMEKSQSEKREGLSGLVREKAGEGLP